MVALRDSGCNTMLIDESLVLTPRLKGREIDLEIQGVNAQGRLLPSTSRDVVSHESGKGKSSTCYEI